MSKQDGEAVVEDINSINLCFYIHIHSQAYPHIQVSAQITHTILYALLGLFFFFNFIWLSLLTKVVIEMKQP